MIAAAIGQQSDPSTRKQLDKVLKNELDRLQQRILQTARGEFFFELTAAAREFLLLQGSEQHYGAQRLKLAIERHVVYALANLLATDQILAGDTVSIDRDHHKPGLTFIRKGKDLGTPARRLAPNGFMSYLPACTGKSLEVLGLWPSM